MSDRSSDIEIYSMWACPYAQRTRILLDLKRIPYKLVEIDLTKPRPAWFLTMNPSGKVPVAVHDGRILNESSLINEYLDETWPEPPVFPRSPYERFAARTLVEFCNSRFAPGMYRVLMEQDDDRRARLQEQAKADWRTLESLLDRFNWLDTARADSFGIVELSYAPFFERYVLTDHYWGIRPWTQPGLERLLRWRALVLANPIVENIGLAAEDYIKLYEDYAYGCSNGTIPDGRSRSSFDLSVPLSDRPLPACRIAPAA